MTEKEILERLKEVVCIGDMSVSEFVKMKQDMGSPLDREAIEDNYYAIKLGHILGKLDNLIADIYLARERKETDKK